MRSLSMSTTVSVRRPAGTSQMTAVGAVSGDRLSMFLGMTPWLTVPGFRARRGRLIGYPAKPNGNTRRERELGPPFGGATRLTRLAPTMTVTIPIEMERAVSIAKGLCRWTISSRTRSVSIRCMATSGNGSRIPGMKIIGTHQRTVRHGRKAVMAVPGCCGAARGTTYRGGCGRPRATGTSRRAGTTAGDSVWPGP